MRKQGIEVQLDSNGCLITTSHKLNADGYCYVRHNGKQQRAHRLIYEECFGEIPPGLVVRHKCDVRNCVNPEHLELGTLKENSMDCIIRGRGRWKQINDDLVREVRRLAGTGMQTKDIARKLNINVHTARKIRERKTWKHVA